MYHEAGTHRVYHWAWQVCGVQLSFCWVINSAKNIASTSFGCPPVRWAVSAYIELSIKYMHGVNTTLQHLGPAASSAERALIGWADLVENDRDRHHHPKRAPQNLVHATRDSCCQAQCLASRNAAAFSLW